MGPPAGIEPCFCHHVRSLVIRALHRHRKGVVLIPIVKALGKLGNVVSETLCFLPIFPSLPITIKYVFEISSNLVRIKY